MAIQTMVLDPNAQSYANLAALDSAAASKLSGIAEGAQVNPANLAALDSTAATKLGTIETNATADQTGAEMRDAIVALTDATRKIIISSPVSTQFKVIAVQRDATGKLAVSYDDVAV